MRPKVNSISTMVKRSITVRNVNLFIAVLFSRITSFSQRTSFVFHTD